MRLSFLMLLFSFLFVCQIKAYEQKDLDRLLKTGNCPKCDLRWSTLKDKNLKSADLQEADLRDSNLNYTNLTNANLHGAKLKRSNLESAVFTGANMENADLTDANTMRIKLQGANLKNAILERVELDFHPQHFQKLINTHKCSDCSLYGADLTNTDLTGAILKNSILKRANLSEANLSGVDLRQANLEDGILKQVNLEKAKLSNSILKSSKLMQANLKDANLEGSDLTEANLSRANLKNANLRGAKLNGALLINTNLTGANLTNANLRGADLTGALLHKTILKNADIKYSDFSYAKITNSDLMGLKIGKVDWFQAENKGNTGVSLPGISYLEDFNFQTCRLKGKHEGASRFKVYFFSKEKTYLVGFNQNRALWRKNLGWFNIAKTSVTCKGSTVSIVSQAPFSSFENKVVYKWQRGRFFKVGSEASDSSEETLVEVVNQLFAGKGINRKKLYSMLYPHRYIYSDRISGIIITGHTKALETFREKKLKTALKILEDTLILSSELSEMIGVCETCEQENTPEKWIKAWNNAKLPVNDYVAALNDYGFFLQKVNRHSKAIEIFEMVLKIAPQRSVVFLNLADSYWEVNRWQKAKSNYQIYANRMDRQNNIQAIPKRVERRLKN